MPGAAVLVQLGAGPVFAGKSWGTVAQSLETDDFTRHLARPWRLWSYRLDDPAFRGFRCRGARPAARLFQICVSLGIGRV